MPDLPSSLITRREALRRCAIGVAAAAVAPSVLAACATTGSSASSGNSGSAGTSGSSTSTTAKSSSGTSSTTSASGGKLDPFDADAAGGVAPKLPKRLALANASDTSLFLDVAKYMQQGCEDRGLDFITAIYNLDPETQVSQTEAFFQRGIGALVEEPINLAASNPQMLKAINEGICSFGVQRPYTHCQVAINQYGTGYGQGIAAVEWAKKTLDGKAQVVYFNDNNDAPTIQDRDHGVLAALKTGGSGIQVVSNITNPETTSGVADAMNTILQAHPDVNIVMGVGSSMLGALAAFQALGRAHDPKVYISSTAGSNADYAAIEAGTVYRATSAEPWNMWSYAIGQFAADWLEGKSIPRGMAAGPFKAGGLEPMLTTVADVKNFASYMENPRKLWQNKTELAKFVSFYGNISYSTRSNWWHQTWNP